MMIRRASENAIGKLISGRATFAAAYNHTIVTHLISRHVPSRTISVVGLIPGCFCMHNEMKSQNSSLKRLLGGIGGGCCKM